MTMVTYRFNKVILRMQRYDKYKEVKWLFTGIGLLIVLFNACSTDDVGIIQDRKPEEVTFKFSVKQPSSASNSIKTYALEEEDEEYIESIDILVFADDGDGHMKFNHRAKGHIDDLPNIEAKLWKTETDSKLVILANVRQQLDEYHFSGEETLEQMQSKLQYELVGEWPAKLDVDEEEFAPFPMWAEFDLEASINGDIDLTVEVSLLRSVARVDVQVSGDAVGKFYLQGVYVFNNNENGLIIPDPNDLLSESPSLPTSLATNNDLSSPLEYETAGDNSIREIYLFEADIASDPGEATTLVISGTFDPTIDGDETLYFYRIDFQDGNGDPIPILRNHKYVINIAGVDYRGDAAEDRTLAFTQLSLLPISDASYFGSTGIKPAQSKRSSYTSTSTRRINTSIKSSSGLQYTITTINEQE